MTKFRVKEELVFEIEAEDKADAKTKLKTIYDNVKINILYREGKIVEEIK